MGEPLATVVAVRIMIVWVALPRSSVHVAARASIPFRRYEAMVSTVSGLKIALMMTPVCRCACVCMHLHVSYAPGNNYLCMHEK